MPVFPVETRVGGGSGKGFCVVLAEVNVKGGAKSSPLKRSFSSNGLRGDAGLTPKRET